MKTLLDSIIRPYSYLSFRRDSKDKYLFTVYEKGEVEVPGFLGQLPDEQNIKGKEFIILLFENIDDECGMKWSIFTTNSDVIKAKSTGEYFKDKELLYISSFYLISEYHAVSTYGKDALIIKFHDNYFSRVTISFIDNFGNDLERLSWLLDHGLIDDRIS
jgi:hypothetical protein